MYVILEHSIIAGFFGSRIAVMLYDFMCYGGIFWKFKYWIAKDLLDYWMPDLVGLNVTEGHDALQRRYDQLSAVSFVIGLLDCKFCMTVWTSIIVAIIGFITFGCSGYIIMMSPIFGYLITEKI